MPHRLPTPTVAPVPEIASRVPAPRPLQAAPDDVAPGAAPRWERLAGPLAAHAATDRIELPRARPASSGAWWRLLGTPAEGASALLLAADGTLYTAVWGIRCRLTRARGLWSTGAALLMLLALALLAHQALGSAMLAVLGTSLLGGEAGRHWDVPAPGDQLCLGHPEPLTPAGLMRWPAEDQAARLAHWEALVAQVQEG